MSERDIELAEQYYAVARDLEMRGNHLLQISRSLGGIADQLCEKNIREQSPTKSQDDEKDCACPGGQAEHLNSCVYCR